MAICYINSQKQICFEDGTPILRPTIVFEKDTDVVHKIGECNSVKEYSDVVINQYNKLRLVTPDLVVMELTRIPVEDACYIIRRAFEYTLSGFLPKLYELVTTKSESEVQTWLANEKSQIPIDVYANI